MALRRGLLALFGLAGAGSLRGETTRPLVLLVDSATEWPMARLRGDELVGGMSLDLAQLLAARMGQPMQAIARPRRRLLQTLQSGEADWVCGYLEPWLPGPLRWSKAFFEQDEFIVTRADHPAPQKLTDLAGQRIGTLLGFVYPELEQALGKRFVREDVASAEANLRKLSAHRLAHIAVSARVLVAAQREARFTTALHPPLLLRRYLTRCALREGAPVDLAQLDRAIDQIQRDGSLRALYRRYDADSTRSSSRP